MADVPDKNCPKCRARTLVRGNAMVAHVRYRTYRRAQCGWCWSVIPERKKP